jgi:hypothetical protein
MHAVSALTSLTEGFLAVIRGDLASTTPLILSIFDL